ncbi:MAG TPA: DHH family phosphoesterase [Phycisphaerae bacterium]|nr:DHH family phosphoesterase [Phycisphaerae bacterium]
MPRGSHKRSDRLLQVLGEYERIVVITHNNPDPDAIAASWALVTLVKERLDRSASLIGGGAVVRAENVRMVDLLRPPLRLVASFTPEEGCAPVLVDCAPEGVNHLLGDGSATPVAVIDHHEAPKSPLRRSRSRIRVKFRDIRPTAAASSCIAAVYLREQRIDPSPRLATALSYAIRTETSGSPVRLTRTDRGVISWLSQQTDHAILAQIENAPLTRAYYNELSLALELTSLHGDTAVCFLPRASGSEIVGEVADLLIRCADVERVLCGAAIGTDLIISIRTSETGGDAVELAGRTLTGLGHWGGHPHRAGGILAGGAETEKQSEELREAIRLRWLTACAVDSLQGVPLIAR